MKRPSKWSWVLVNFALLSSVSITTGQSLEGDFRKKGIHVRTSFDSVTEVFQTSCAVLYDQTIASAYGVVVSKDGQILVKASELEEMEKASVIIGKKRYREFEVLAKDPAWDLALIQVDTSGLTPIVWSESVPIHGTIVISNSATSRFQRRGQMGVVSANARPVGAAGLAVLGVAMSGEEEGVIRISGVAPESGADKAGLEKEDLISAIDGEEVTTAEEVIAALKEKLPGEEVALRIQRGEEEIAVEVELGERQNVFQEQMTRNDSMSGEFSRRRTNFPNVLQHDTPLTKRTVGGPLLTLNGECVGMNIAYASREASYAIPAEDLPGVLAELRLNANQERK